ncbi:RHS repeat-associated core domain-containing protein [Pseudomonas fluorescens]|nr:RHS repeat-associated core domain-containing protein [Pseudomonas fluorescens]
MPTIHRFTPKLIATDPNGLVVRSVDYYCAEEKTAAAPRTNHTVHDWAGRAVAQRDPRVFLEALAPPNSQTVYTLSGAALSTTSVDAGWRVALLGEAGHSVHAWDGRGSQRWVRYDTQLRPEWVFEEAVGGEAVCMERLGYGLSDQASAEHNQCGQLIRHDDPAGTQLFVEFGLHGAVLEQTRHFLNDLTQPDWPESIADRDRMWEPGEGATSRSHLNAAGEVIKQTDAKGHRQLFSQNLDGQLRAVHLQLKGDPSAKTLVSGIAYNAHGQTEREVTGNGVITTLKYDAQNGRLIRLLAQRGNEALQDLHHEYDAKGNVLSIADAALPTRYFANQRIEPVNYYSYDSQSQLIEATGWEAGSASKGPQFATFDDPAPRANYRQRYRYDAGGNLLELIHEGPQSHAHRLLAAAHSNHCLPVLEGVEPGEDDFRRGFDGNGNLLNLQPGQALAWDLRNQLCEVRPVERDSGLNDRERYVYGADGMRLRKVRETHTNARTLTAEARYLPNLELRTNSGTGEVLQVISVQTGRCNVRVLHWESEPPKDIGNDQYRYGLNDHLGSCSLELDSGGELISQERYHPFGSTASFAGRGETEASYKTVRYSGKERDATGLYYYGFRYYRVGWQRWINPDPAGSADGLNGYLVVGNNPIAFRDLLGMYGEAINKDIHLIWAGENPAGLRGNVANMNNTVEQADGYKVYLHLESRAEDTFSEVIKDLKIHAVDYMNGGELFEGFNRSPVATIYQDFRFGHVKNTAFAVDALRPYVIDELGGIYSDVDDIYYDKDTETESRLGSTPLMALPDQVLTLTPVFPPWESSRDFSALKINNSSFAAHPNNAVLKELMGEMASRYKAVAESGRYKDIMGLGHIGYDIFMSDPGNRTKIMTSMVGPQVFEDVILRSDPEFNALFTQYKTLKPSVQVDAGFIEKVNIRMPLSRFIEVGALQTWM